MAIFKRKTSKTNNNSSTNTKTSSSSSTSSSTSPPKTSKPTPESKSLFRKIWAKKSKKPQKITATCKPQWEWSNTESIDWLTKVLIHYCNQLPSRALENARGFMSSSKGRLSERGEIEEKKDGDEVEEEVEEDGDEEKEEENEEELDGKYLFSATPEEWAAKLGADDGKKVFCLIFHWRNEDGGMPEGISFPHFEREEDSYSYSYS